MKALTKKERKLLFYLDENCRYTNTQLAKKVGVAVSSIAYMINKLVSSGIIEEFYFLLNPFALSGGCNRLIVNFKADWNVEEVKEYCEKHKEIGWYILFDSPWSFTCQILTDSVVDTNREVKKFLSRFSQHVQEYTLSSVVSIHKYEHNFIFPGKQAQLTKLAPMKKVKLNDMDHKIIQHFFRNARAKIIDMARTLNTDYKTISYRLNRLRKLGVIVGFKTKLNRFSLGYDYYKIRLEFSSFEQTELNKLKEELINNKNILFITEALGWADLEFEIFCKDQQEYRTFQREFKRKYANNIKTYETLIPLEFQWNRIFPD